MCVDCNSTNVTLPTGPPGPLGANSGKPIINLSLTGDNNTDYRYSIISSYSTLATINYPGSTEIGSTPSKVSITYAVIGSGTGNIRIVDNNSNLIAAINVSTSAKAIASTTIVASESVLSSGVYWEVQVQGSTEIRLYSVTIY